MHYQNGSLEIQRWLIWPTLVCLIAALLWVTSAAAAAADEGQARALSLEGQPWTGDFSGMQERRLIRVLAPFSRSLYFNDRGHERGLTAELVRDFETFINKKYKKVLARRPITVVIIPTTRERLLPQLLAGYGDIAAGNLTATPQRLKTVDFVAPDDAISVRELLVTGPTAPQITNSDELAGKTVHVRRAASYYDSLVALNKRLKAAGRTPVDIVLVPDALEDEDMMEMLNAGLLQTIVVDDWKAALWAQILPNIKVHEDIVLRDGGKIGWAMRKASPELEAELLDFYSRHVKKQGVTAYRLKKLMKRVKQIKDPTGEKEWQRFERTVAIFRKYGAQYRFDPLMLAAQGFQESRINQDARSHVGAIGIMQIMPATGEELDVGDIHLAEPNVHAGAKYMDQLMTRYFQDANFDAQNRTLFAFASYNAGPGNISKMRKLAVKRGLDPDKWFNNVEIVTAEKIGLEPVTYVRNIYKYFISYRLTVDAREAGLRAREAVIAPDTK